MADPVELDDAELVARHLAGDAQAFDALVRRHRDRAWSVAMRTLGDPTEAADAVQDAFVSAYRSISSFRAEAKFSTWLHRIVVNACLDRVRRARARPTVPLDDAMGATLADPRDVLDERDTSRVVTDALRLLGDDQRAAIVLVDLHGLSVEEAAEVLGVPTGTVKSRCHRGRAALAGHLGHLRPRPGGTPDPPGASQPQPTEAPTTPANPEAGPR
jgi:RNA polymerase sigma-70 factor (ECF subfamily)